MIMKTPVLIALVIFGATVAYVLFGGLFFTQENASARSTPTPAITATPETTVLPTGSSPTATQSGYTAAEVAKHDTPGDCWMVINGKVYDVTQFLGSHPGGAEIMLPYCGQEATQAFDTKGGRGNGHSGGAQDLLNAFYVGDFKA